MTVRQIVFRLTRLWERMQSGADKKPKPIEIRRAANRAISQRLRANMTPEQREAFLQYHREYAKKNLRAAAVRKKRWYDIHADQIKKKRRGQVKKPSLGF